MDRLSQMPNLGKKLERIPEQAGKLTPADRIGAGNNNAFLRIRPSGQEACLSKLCALEGAVRCFRWHDLPKDVKSDLHEFSKLNKV